VGTVVPKETESRAIVIGAGVTLFDRTLSD